MRHWWQIAFRNLRTRYVRAAVALAAVVLGVALATAVNVGYGSARQAILMWNYSWVGHSHVHVQPIPSEIWASQRLPLSAVEAIGRLPGVRQVITRQKEDLELPPGQVPGSEKRETISGYGLDIAGERQTPGVGVRLAPGGRMPAPGAGGEVLVERSLADRMNKTVGDTMQLAGFGPPRTFRIVGVLVRPRLHLISNQAEFTMRPLVMVSQADMEKLFEDRPPLVGTTHVPFESIDVVLDDASVENVRRMAERIRELPELGPNVQVDAADEQIRQLDRNMSLFRQVSRAVSVVALLTTAYIIFATLGMGMVQQQAELGTLRCVGAGRGQIVAATFLEAVPIAAAGVTLGLCGGLLTMRWIIHHYQDHAFFNRLVVTADALLWSALGGLIAVALAVALPAWLASRVSPLAASRPQANRLTVGVDLWVGLVGVGLVGLSLLTRSSWPGRLVGLDYDPSRQAPVYLAVGVPLLFVGYFLLAPLVVASAGWVVKFLSAGLLVARPRLLDDQMQTARWRTAATCCALMVGISMLVNLRVHSESIIRGWELPTQMPAGFLFFFDPIDPDQLGAIRRYPQIADSIALTAFWVRYQVGPTSDDSVTARFLSGPLGPLERLVRVNFTAGLGADPARWKERAFEALGGGGAVIATREFAARHRVRIGSTVRFWRHDADRFNEFEIVGIIESLTLDMAIDFLNIRDRFANLAAGTVIGSIRDANAILLPEHPGAAHPGADPTDSQVPLETRIVAFDFAGVTVNEAGEKVLPPPAVQQQMLEQVGRQLREQNMPRFWAGSFQELHQLIVGEFREVVSILQRVALWAVMIASLGVGFAMAANVHSRRRQLAVLRAVGATRWQLARLVLAEAITIALIGSLLGIGHGLHLAGNANYFDRELFGLTPRFSLQPRALGLAAGFAAVCCLVASLVPALRAARTNILAAMRHL